MAATITAEGRTLVQKMDKVNQDYWYNQWHKDIELHKNLGIKNVTTINSKTEETSIYIDTDSLFVSFKPAIDNCDWKNLVFNNTYLNTLTESFVILSHANIKTSNPNCLSIVDNIDDLSNYISSKPLILVDGAFIKERSLFKLIGDNNLQIEWNWSNELDFILGLDHYRYEGYFKKCLNEHADSYGIENKQDFELEKVSESIISIAKKKYIGHIIYEDGIRHDRFDYIYPKGVELVRSSTPTFARVKIMNIVNYLFANPDTFNIKELLKLVKSLRKEFELADIDDIALQSSVSNYETKMLNDKELPLQFTVGAHFAVKCAGHYNYLLSKNKELQQKYEFIKSGTKIKYYCCKDKSITDMFAYIRGSYPIEFAPEIDYDLQFSKSILSPINSIITPLGLPTITERLSVVMDIFGGF